MGWIRTRDLKDGVVTAAKLASGTLTTATIADEAVTVGKMADLTRGSILVGTGATNRPAALDVKTSGRILVGNGTDPVLVAVSGDATLAANGAVTVASKAITTAKLDDNAVTPAKTALKSFFKVEEDFTFAPSATLPLPLAKDVQTVNITGDFLADTAAGVYRFLTDATSEAQAGQVTFGDQLLIDPTKNPVLEAWVRLAPAGAALTADERVVIGLCSAHTNAEDSLDAVVNHAWFRIEGASLAILVEADDGTTDTDDQDSTIVLVKSAWTHLKIDMTDLAAIVFEVDGVAQGGAAVSAPLLATPLQFIACIQRDAGTEANSLDIDWLVTYADRS